MSLASIHASRDSRSTISGFADPISSVGLLHAPGHRHGMREPHVPPTSSRFAQAGSSAAVTSYRTGTVEQETSKGLSSLPLAIMPGQLTAESDPVHGAAGAIAAGGIHTQTCGTLGIHRSSNPIPGTGMDVACQGMPMSGISSHSMAGASSQLWSSTIAPAKTEPARPPARRHAGTAEASGQ